MNSAIEPGIHRDPGLRRTIHRNTVLLAGCLALSWAVVQLLATVGAPILAELTGRPSLAGVAPAIFVAWWAVATLLVGRYMDVRGRVSGIRLGFVAGAAGCLLVFLGTRERSLPLFLLGMALAGGGAGAVNLARAGAADMYPPERRARGISYVLVGAAFGAILGPVAFIPLLAGAGRDLDVLGPPWLAAAILMLAGVALTLAIRVDPLEIARGLRHPAGGGDPRPGGARPLAAMLRVPVVRVALVAAIVAQTVMTAMMSIVALVLHHHGHEWPTVAVSMSAHFLGMFGLVLVAGRVVDRIGRDRAVVLGLLVLTGGILTLLAEVELQWVAPAMFAIGVGWNVAFVAATTMLADATEPLERARLLGFVDFAALGSAAVGSILAGMVLETFSLGALVVFGAVLALVPVVLYATRLPRGGVGPVPDGARQELEPTAPPRS
jgi:MFS family permease